MFGFAFACIAIFGLRCVPEKRFIRPPGVVVFFADVTASMVPSERNKVAADAAQLIAGLPERTQFYLYPVTADMPKAQLIIADTVPGGGTATKRRVRDAWRVETENNIEAEINRLAGDEINGPERINKRSCIFGALEVAQRQIEATGSGRTGDFAVVLISDMLEECEQTPIGRAIDISSATTIDSERKMLTTSAGMFPNLHGIKVMALIPTTQDSQPTVHGEKRPTMNQVRAYWQSAIALCNVAPADFWLDSDDRALDIAKLLSSDARAGG